MANASKKSWLELGVMTCEVCQFKTSDQGLLQAHICRKRKDKVDNEMSKATIKYSAVTNRFLCTLCFFESKESEFFEHIQQHLVRHPYKCDICHRGFSSRNLIDKHCRVKHPSSVDSFTLRISDSSKNILDDAKRLGASIFIPFSRDQNKQCSGKEVMVPHDKTKPNGAKEVIVCHNKSKPNDAKEVIVCHNKSKPNDAKEVIVSHTHNKSKPTGAKEVIVSDYNKSKPSDEKEIKVSHDKSKPSGAKEVIVYHNKSKPSDGKESKMSHDKSKLSVAKEVIVSHDKSKQSGAKEVLVSHDQSKSCNDKEVKETSDKSEPCLEKEMINATTMGVLNVVMDNVSECLFSQPDTSLSVQCSTQAESSSDMTKSCSIQDNSFLMEQGNTAKFSLSVCSHSTTPLSVSKPAVCPVATNEDKIKRKGSSQFLLTNSQSSLPSVLPVEKLAETVRNVVKNIDRSTSVYNYKENHITPGLCPQSMLQKKCKHDIPMKSTPIRRRNTLDTHNNSSFIIQQPVTYPHYWPSNVQSRPLIYPQTSYVPVPMYQYPQQQVRHHFSSFSQNVYLPAYFTNSPFYSAPPILQTCSPWRFGNQSHILSQAEKGIPCELNNSSYNPASSLPASHVENVVTAAENVQSSGNVLTPENRLTSSDGEIHVSVSNNVRDASVIKTSEPVKTVKQERLGDYSYFRVVNNVCLCLKCKQKFLDVDKFYRHIHKDVHTDGHNCCSSGYSIDCPLLFEIVSNLDERSLGQLKRMQSCLSDQPNRCQTLNFPSTNELLKPLKLEKDEPETESILEDSAMSEDCSNISNIMRDISFRGSDLVQPHSCESNVQEEISPTSIVEKNCNFLESYHEHNVPDVTNSNSILAVNEQNCINVDILDDDLERFHNILIEQMEKNFYKCCFSNCEFSSHKSINYLIHTEQHHGNETEFHCLYCGYVGGKVTDLLHHITVHNEKQSQKYSCSLLTGDNSTVVETMSNQKLDALLVFVHARSRQYDSCEFQCNFCHSKFLTLTKLRLHLHCSTLKTFGCCLCSSTFLDLKSFEYHFNKLHPERPKFQRINVNFLCQFRKENLHSFYKILQQTIKNLSSSGDPPDLSQQSSGSSNGRLSPVADNLEISSNESLIPDIDTVGTSVNNILPASSSSILSASNILPTSSISSVSEVLPVVSSVSNILTVSSTSSGVVTMTCQTLWSPGITSHSSIMSTLSQAPVSPSVTSSSVKSPTSEALFSPQSMPLSNSSINVPPPALSKQTSVACEDNFLISMVTDSQPILAVSPGGEYVTSVSLNSSCTLPFTNAAHSLSDLAHIKPVVNTVPVLSSTATQNASLSSCESVRLSPKNIPDISSLTYQSTDSTCSSLSLVNGIVSPPLCHKSCFSKSTSYGNLTSASNLKPPTSSLSLPPSSLHFSSTNEKSNTSLLIGDLEVKRKYPFTTEGNDPFTTEGTAGKKKKLAHGDGSPDKESSKGTEKGQASMTSKSIFSGKVIPITPSGGSSTSMSSSILLESQAVTAVHGVKSVTSFGIPPHLRTSSSCKLSALNQNSISSSNLLITTSTGIRMSVPSETIGCELTETKKKAMADNSVNREALCDGDHYSNVCSEEDKENEKKSVFYECLLCSFYCEWNKQDMEAHITEKHKYFACSYCENPYFDLQQLRNHIKYHHNNASFEYKSVGIEHVFSEKKNLRLGKSESNMDNKNTQKSVKILEYDTSSEPGLLKEKGNSSSQEGNVEEIVIQREDHSFSQHSSTLQKDVNKTGVMGENNHSSDPSPKLYIQQNEVKDGNVSFHCSTSSPSGDHGAQNIGELNCVSHSSSNTSSLDPKEDCVSLNKIQKPNGEHTKKKERRPFKCNHCCNFFSSIFEIEKHYTETHVGITAKWIYTKNYCTFSLSGQLLTGKDTSRPAARPYLCSLCPYHREKREKVNRHLQEFHPGDIHGRVVKLHGFDELIPSHSSSSTQSKSSREHIRVIRKEPNCYNCHLCCARLSTEFHLRYHLAKHGGFKHTSTSSIQDGVPICGHCSYIAQSTSDLANHVTIHVTDRRYKCSLCDCESHYKKSILSHIEKQHGPNSSGYVHDREKNKGKMKLQLVDLNPTVVLNRLCMDKVHIMNS